MHLIVSSERESGLSEERPYSFDPNRFDHCMGDKHALRIDKRANMGEGGP